MPQPDTTGDNLEQYINQISKNSKSEEGLQEGAAGYGTTPSAPGHHRGRG